MVDPIPPPQATASPPSTDTWAKQFNSWGALIVSFAILALYATHTSDDTMKALVMVVGGYWLGSSNSSQKKDDTLAANSIALAGSTPPTTVTTTTGAEPGRPATLTTTTGPAAAIGSVPPVSPKLGG